MTGGQVFGRGWKTERSPVSAGDEAGRRRGCSPRTQRFARGSVRTLAGRLLSLSLRSSSFVCARRGEGDLLPPVGVLARYRCSARRGRETWRLRLLTEGYECDGGTGAWASSTW